MKKNNMEKEYHYNCRGCHKPDTDFPVKFQDYETGEPMYNAPKVTEHRWARQDAYGIYTGLYCDKCFKNNYPYRTDRYFDESYAGERLEEDY